MQNPQTLRPVLTTIWQVCKWLVVFYLLWPLQNLTAQQPVSLPRVMLGILLFIIFSGKILYDTIIDRVKEQRESKRVSELLTLLGIVILMALVVGIFLVLIGLTVYAVMQQQSVPQQQP
jgi:Na+/proline symporter